MRSQIVLVLIAFAMCGCSIGGAHVAVRPLIFERAPVIQPTVAGAGIRFIAPRSDLPGGGALVTLGTRVLNPNNFEVTLQTLKGTLYLDERSVGTANLQPRRVLNARADTQMTIEVLVNFSNQPTVEAILRRAQTGQRMHYRLEGTIGLDAPGVGSGMVFGPTTLVYGEMNGVVGPDDRVVLSRDGRSRALGYGRRRVQSEVSWLCESPCWYGTKQAFVIGAGGRFRPDCGLLLEGRP